MADDPLKIALLGLGNVGTGVARILVNQPNRILSRSGRQVVIAKALVRDLKKSRDVNLPAGTMTNDVESIIRDPEIKVGVELIGGIHPAKEIVLDLLRHGKDVVTANKALLCEHGQEIFNEARRLGRTVAFEAAVAGGIPIIAAVGQSMAANQILAMQAILNGTSNYILSEMSLKQKSYAEALQQARALGYAEADPTLDVNGTDAAQKLMILTQLAHGTRVPIEQFHVSGIDQLELIDIANARQLGYTIKLLASAKLVQNRLEMSVRPTLVRQDRPLAQIHGPFNAILMDGDVVGEMWFSGRGAGQFPTASAVTADIIDLAIGRAQLTFKQLDLWRERPEFSVADEANTTHRFYIRMLVEDRPHVMSDITHVLGKNGISLASVNQPEVRPDEAGLSAPFVPLIIMTHPTTSGNLRAAEDELVKLSSLRQPMVVLAVVS